MEAADLGWRRLAQSDALSPGLQVRLWRSGDAHTRRILASRADLVAEISSQIAHGCYPEFTRPWASSRERPQRLVSAAVRATPTTDETTLVFLAAQENLSGASASLLLAASSGAVAETLLRRGHLPPELRRCAARVLCSTYVRAGWPEASALVERIGSDPDAWIEALSAAPSGSTAVAVAALEACGEHPGVITAVVRWLRTNPASPLEEQRRDTARCLDGLMRYPSLAPDDLEALAELATDFRREERARSLAALDLPSRLHALQRGAASTADLRCLAAAVVEGVRLPLDLLLEAVLTHPERAMLVAEISRLQPRLDQAEYFNLVSRLWRSGEHQLAVEVVESRSSVSAFTDEAFLPDLVALLCQRRAGFLLRAVLPEAERAFVVENFSPLTDVLTVPELAGLVAARLEMFARDDESLCETALVLLQSWQGSLDELLRTSVALAHPART